MPKVKQTIIIMKLKSKAMKAAACWEGTTSKANGSLMRCTPIGKSIAFSKIN